MQQFDDDGNPIPETPDLVRQREQIEALEKDLKDAQKERDKLRSRVTEQEQAQKASDAREAFKKAGFPEAQANLFLKVNPEAEPTVEAIKTFADEYNLAKPAAAQAEPEKPAETKPEEFFEPTQGGGPPEAGKITEEQLAEALRKGDTDFWMRAQLLDKQNPGTILWKHPEAAMD